MCSSLISPSESVTIPHPGKAHALVKAGDILLVAAEAVERLSDDDFEPAATGIGHQPLNARAQQRGSRDGPVGVFLDDHPALPLRMKAANAQLIGN
jgi:hypothetical protein